MSSFVWDVLSFVQDMEIIWLASPRGGEIFILLSKAMSCDSYRKRLFNMINELPTVFDVVTGKKIVKDKPVANNNSGAKAKSTTKVVSANELLPRHFFIKWIHALENVLEMLRVV